MRLRFVGHLLPGWAGPEGSIEMLPGLRMPYGEWIEVPDEAAGKLAAHPHIEAMASSPEGEPITDWRTLDKAALDAYAAAHGVTLDRRKTLARMQADFAAAVDNAAAG